MDQLLANENLQSALQSYPTKAWLPPAEPLLLSCISHQKLQGLSLYSKHFSSY
ncbi:hypothetical protein ACI48O_20535 [Neobacillus sp. LXY-4]